MYLNKKFLSLFVFICLVTLNVNAQKVNRESARAIAQDFLKSRGRNVELAPESAIGMNGQRKAVKSGQAPLYMFNIENDGGFVIISGDDRTEQVLGYVDEGSCDMDKMPENMKAWLQMYAEQIENLPDDYQPTPITENSAAKAKRATRKSVSALCKTKWNQGDPYNLLCPMDGDSHCVTGCVATAFAQIMYYHKWPVEETTKIPTYYVLNQWLPELPETTFDWSNMLTTYGDNASEAQRNAVAKLMFYCGQATQMGYSAAGSGAYSGNVKTALLNYFDYDGTAQFIYRSDYSIEGWDEIIYNELYEKRPVYYAGYAPGGHAFVCDGYDRTGGYFHFNWGWGGWDDGYFRLSLLNADDPKSDGMSATGIGFSMGQECVIGIQPQQGTPVKNTTHLSINDTSVSGTKIFSNYINWTGSKNSFNGAIVTTDEEGKYVAISNIQTANDLEANYYNGWTFDIAGKLPEGQHKVSPASKLTTEEEWIPLYNFENNYILADVDASGNMTLTIHPVRNIAKVSFDNLGSKVANTEQKIAIKVENGGDEYNGTVCLFASKTTAKGEECCRTQLEVPENGSNTIYMFFTPTEDGDYTLWLTTEGGDVLGTGSLRIGGKPNITADSGTQSNTNEGYAKLFDGNTDSKWCFNLSGTSSNVIFHTDQPVFINGYRFATGDDTKTYTGRNPQSWVLYGSTSATKPSVNDASWEVISDITGNSGIKAYNKCYFTFPVTQTTASKAYKYFKLNIRSVSSGTMCQISEFDLITDGFYLYNTSSGLWLQGNDRNEDYATDRAELGNRGIDVEIVPLSDGYQINPKFGGNHSINTSDLNMSSSDATSNWALAAVSAGSEDYYIQQGDKYLGADGSENNFLSTEASSENGTWKVYSRAARIAEMSTANIDNPADVSWLIRGGDFSNNDERFNEWVVSSDATSNKVNGGTKVKCNRIFDSRAYKTHSYLTQKITDIPNGVYKLTVEGAYTNEESDTYYYLSSGEEIAQHSLILASSLGTVSNIAYDLYTGTYHNDDDVKLEVKDNTLTVGVKSDITGSTTGRFVVDNFRLTYYDPTLPSGIEAIRENTSAPTGIYNLQGQRLSSPIKGINIINGKKVLR